MYKDTHFLNRFFIYYLVRLSTVYAYFSIIVATTCNIKVSTDTFKTYIQIIKNSFCSYKF